LTTHTQTSKNDKEVRVMCIKSNEFLEICDFYPRTKANFKFRALERRQKIMKLVERSFREKFH
jgi:hypothetical protein